MVYLGGIRACNRGVLTDLRVRQRPEKSNSAEKAEQQQTFVWGLKEQYWNLISQLGLAVVHCRPNKGIMSLTSIYLCSEKEDLQSAHASSFCGR